MTDDFDDICYAWLQTILDMEDPLVDREMFYRGALFFAGLRRWRPGWAFHAYQARYGEDEQPEPEWLRDGPIEPTPNHLAWMREYYDAYRRGKRMPKAKALPANVIDLASRRKRGGAA
jgi:hypothetical protein